MILRVVLVSLFTLLLSSSVLSDDIVRRMIKYGEVVVVTKGSLVEVIVAGRDTVMRNVLRTRNPGAPNRPLQLDTNCGPSKVCVKNGNITYATLDIQPHKEVVTITRSLQNPNAELVDCYDLGENVQWFGGPQLRYQHWPIQNMYFQDEPYVPTHPANMAVSERYWLSSKGVYIFVDDRVPLFIDQNNRKSGYMCLVAKNGAPYRRRPSVSLNYEIGLYPDPKLAHEHVVSTHLGKPSGIPNQRMIQFPIWSTWARYKANVSESTVETFGNEIVSYGFPNSQLEIDDNWETCYGSAVFDTKKFPNITALVRRLKAKGFRVTLWIHPFINEGCQPAYNTALNNSYFAKSIDGRVRTSWWQGERAAAIDFTNPRAVTWWVARLKLLQNAGIDSFKFDAGEVSWLPQVASLTGVLDRQPGIFTYDYVSALAKNFDDNIEVRVGWRSQELPIFVRMIDKDTTWTMNNGLPTLVTTLLQMNMNGYVHVLPDMIGGNGYLNGQLNGTVYPPKEMFIRWLQANVFMPSLQYSFVPWDFDQETVNISRKFTNLHAQYSPIIAGVMRLAVSNGAPVNPPVWWVDPTNEEAHKISDEYMLGEVILVAPVLEEDAVTRDVYLPAGKWRDGNSDTVYTGPRWIRDYPAPLDTLPYFLKQ